MQVFTMRWAFRNRLTRSCAEIVEAAFGAAEARRMFAMKIEQTSGAVSGWLDVLEISYDVLLENGAEFPKSGPVLLLANHPSGVLDGLILLDLCLSIREDVKILARGDLRKFSDTGRLIIPLPLDFDRNGWADHLEAKRQAQDFLASGGVVIIFGGGVVNRWYRMTFTEGKWAPFVGKLSVGERVQVVPVFLGIQCSRFYKLVSFFSISGQRMLLLREILVKRGHRFPVVIGKTLMTAKLEEGVSHKFLAMVLRARVLRLGRLLELGKNHLSLLMVTGSRQTSASSISSPAGQIGERARLCGGKRENDPH